MLRRDNVVLKYSKKHHRVNRPKTVFFQNNFSEYYINQIINLKKIGRFYNFSGILPTFTAIKKDNIVLKYSQK